MNGVHIQPLNIPAAAMSTIALDIERYRTRLIQSNKVAKELYNKLFFTARCYASAVLAMGLRLSVTSRCSTKTDERIELVFGT